MPTECLALDLQSAVKSCRWSKLRPLTIGSATEGREVTGEACSQLQVVDSSLCALSKSWLLWLRLAEVSCLSRSKQAYFLFKQTAVCLIATGGRLRTSPEYAFQVQVTMQLPMLGLSIVLLPPHQLWFQSSYDGEWLVLYDFEVTPEHLTDDFTWWLTIMWIVSDPMLFWGPESQLLCSDRVATTYRAKQVTREERRNAVMKAAHPSRASPSQSRRQVSSSTEIQRLRSGSSPSEVPQSQNLVGAAGAFSQSPAVRLGLPLPTDPVRAARALRTPAEVHYPFMYSANACTWISTTFALGVSVHALSLSSMTKCRYSKWNVSINGISETIAYTDFNTVHGLCHSQYLNYVTTMESTHAAVLLVTEWRREETWWC